MSSSHNLECFSIQNVQLMWIVTTGCLFASEEKFSKQQQSFKSLGKWTVTSVCHFGDKRSWKVISDLCVSFWEAKTCSLWFLGNSVNMMQDWRDMGKKDICQKKICLCHWNSGFFHDLIFVEVSELDGVVWFMSGSVCKLFCSCQCAFNFSTQHSLTHELFNRVSIILSLILKI